MNFWNYFKIKVDKNWLNNKIVHVFLISMHSTICHGNSLRVVDPAQNATKMFMNVKMVYTIGINMRNKIGSVICEISFKCDNYLFCNIKPLNVCRVL